VWNASPCRLILLNGRSIVWLVPSLKWPQCLLGNNCCRCTLISTDLAGPIVPDAGLNDSLISSTIVVITTCQDCWRSSVARSCEPSLYHVLWYYSTQPPLLPHVSSRNRSSSSFLIPLILNQIKGHTQMHVSHYCWSQHGAFVSRREREMWESGQGGKLKV
jgi:hypothetical protein